MKRNSTIMTLAAMASWLLLSLSVTARDVTDIAFTKPPYGNIRAEVSLTPGEAGDDHVVYISWDAEDRGPSLGNWPATNIVRVGNIAADATSVTALLPESAEKGRAFRAFLATSKRTGNFDSLIACIRSAGGAYIDTGFCLTTNSEVFLDFQVPEYEAVRTVTDYDLFGAFPDGKVMMAYRVYFARSDWRWYYAFKSQQWEQRKYTFGGTGTLADSSRTAITLSPRTWTWRFQRASDGTDLSGTLSHNNVDPSNLSLSLFATHTSSGFARVATNGVIYAASIKESDAYVRKMQPAVRNGEAGLWDVVNDTFYASAGSRPFYATETDGVAFATVSFDDAFTDLIVPGETQVAASDVQGFSDRKVTGLSFRQKPGRDAVATAKLTPGAANDVDALYLAWGDRDYGEDMDAWPSSMRVCALSGSVTEHSFSVTNEMDGVTCFRAFLATAWHPGVDKAIECVRSVGGAYIDTGFRCGAETRVMVDMQMPDCLKADAGAIYGMASTGTLYGVIFQKIKNYERFDYSFNKNGTTTWVGYLNCSTELRQRVEMSSVGKTFSLAFPAKSYSTSNNNVGNQGVDRTNLPLFIFARSEYDGDGYIAESILPHGLLFGATIQEDEEYRRLFYPCVKGGVAGLCDFVGNTFYPSVGQAAFLAADADGVPYPEAAFPVETVFTASPVAKAKAIRGTWLMVQ